MQRKILLWHHYFRWCQHFWLMTSSKSSKTRIFTYMTIKNEPLIIERRLTTQIKAIIKPLQKNEEWLTHNGLFLLTSAVFQQFFAKKWENDVTWRKMTSSCRIFTKTSGNVCLLDIMLWCKYEVICAIVTQVMNIFVFSASIWKYIGKSYLSLTKLPYLHF